MPSLPGQTVRFLHLHAGDPPATYKWLALAPGSWRLWIGISTSKSSTGKHMPASESVAAYSQEPLLMWRCAVRYLWLTRL